jgi:hypothetical protein
VNAAGAGAGAAALTTSVRAGALDRLRYWLGFRQRKRIGADRWQSGRRGHADRANENRDKNVTHLVTPLKPLDRSFRKLLIQTALQLAVSGFVYWFCYRFATVNPSLERIAVRGMPVVAVPAMKATTPPGVVPKGRTRLQRSRGSSIGWSMNHIKHGGQMVDCACSTKPRLVETSRNAIV